jgi:hypothetical protein
MFVRGSTYERLHVQHMMLQAKFNRLLAEHNAIVHEINRKGGREFLDKARIIGVNDIMNGVLNANDIKRLLMLCHPDRHDGKQSAVEMTQRLLLIRKALSP